MLFDSKLTCYRGLFLGITMNHHKDTQSDLIIKQSVHDILKALGEDTDRPGLKDTPERVVGSLTFLCEGYQKEPKDVVGDAIFPCESEGIVIQKGIEFFSLCEHHMLPFFGQVHVAYLPNKQIIGLSKIGRLIDMFARRLQVQEHLTHQIAQAIDDLLNPKGVGVIIEAQHFCMMMRGVKKQGAFTITSEYRGELANNQLCKSDFLEHIRR